MVSKRCDASYVTRVREETSNPGVVLRLIARGLTKRRTHVFYYCRGDTVRTLKATVTEGQEVRRLDDSNSGELGDQHIVRTRP